MRPPSLANIPRVSWLVARCRGAHRRRGAGPARGGVAFRRPDRRRQAHGATQERDQRDRRLAPECRSPLGARRRRQTLPLCRRRHRRFARQSPDRGRREKRGLGGHRRGRTRRQGLARDWRRRRQRREVPRPPGALRRGAVRRASRDRRDARGATGGDVAAQLRRRPPRLRVDRRRCPGAHALPALQARHAAPPLPPRASGAAGQRRGDGPVRDDGAASPAAQRPAGPPERPSRQTPRAALRDGLHRRRHRRRRAHLWGSPVVSASSRGILGEALAREPVRLAAHDLPQAEAACFSPDGKRIFVASESSRKLLRYDRR